ncbi:MAG: arsenate reductase ArsC [Bryobacterales bacterium]|nr:arsenate reductase ArsC [Bryobacterales bacterium]
MTKRILVLCTGNSARSQMAEGLLRAMDPSLDVHSAGTDPAPRVHPLAVEAMREAGIDISSHTPKSVSRYSDESFDHMITVCSGADGTCPAFTGRIGHRIHIGFEDPAAAPGSTEEQLAVFRRVRDEIKSKLGAYIWTSGK